MAIDDPLDALEKQLELEESSSSSIAKRLISILEATPGKGWFMDAIIRAIAQAGKADDRHKSEVLISTLFSELRRLNSAVESLRDSSGDQSSRIEAASNLLLDGFRKALATRSLDRVKRIGTILAHGMVEPLPIDEDEIEEMMRVATELTDEDVRYLGELVDLEGGIVRASGRLDRYSAHTQWERGPWGTRIESRLDSSFSKLESYGLVSRIAPPNNLNIGADFQNRYVLLKKGLRFADLIKQASIDS